MEDRDLQFIEKAVAIIELELHPPTDGLTSLVDERTGIGVREPTAPSQPVAPDQPARREFEGVPPGPRHGTADLLAAFAVLSRLVYGIVRPRQRSAEFIELLRVLDARAPRSRCFTSSSIRCS